MDKVNILGVPVDVIDRPALLRRIDELASASSVSLVNNVNAHACNLAVSDPEFL
jgi:UDP-N-acetyl-D-mannosaminuronic acid transferase (WecB/TagA/CpsF family)